MNRITSLMLHSDLVWNFHNSVNELIHFLVLCCFVPCGRPQQSQSIAKFLHHLLSPNCHESSLTCILLGGNFKFTRFQVALLGTHHCHLWHPLSDIQIEVLPIQNSLPSERKKFSFVKQSTILICWFK